MLNISIYLSAYFRLKGSADTSLAGEMSELFDKQVNPQKGKTSGVHTSSRKPMKKCAMKMKETNKQEKRMHM